MRVGNVCIPIFVLAMVAPAYGADLGAAPPVLKSEPIVSPAHNWAGAYGGFHAGYTWADVSQFDPFGGGTQLDYGADGFIYGGQLGYNLQAGQVVFGVEGDFSFGDVSGGTTTAGNAPSFKIKKSFSLRGRLGISHGRHLLYATAGATWAYARVNDPLQGAGPFTDSHRHSGYVVGGGIDWLATDRVSVRAEYLYANYGSKNYVLGAAPDPVDFDTHTVRAAINWHF